MALNINTDVLEVVSHFSHLFPKKPNLLVLFECGLTQRKENGMDDGLYNFFFYSLILNTRMTGY